MKNVLALVLLVLPAAAQRPESILLDAERLFFAAPAAVVHPDLQEPREPVLQPHLVPAPMRPSAAPGKELVRVRLASQLDRHHNLLTRRLGAKDFTIGAASDAKLSTYFLAFTEGGVTRLAPLGDLNRLRGSGVDARVDGSTVYNFRVSINIFSPTRGSTLKMTPAAGTRGPAHEVKTGTVLDAVKARATVFSAGGKEFWLHFGRDAKADGSGFSDTRTLLFIQENGLSSKAWPLAEGALTPGAAAVVDLGGVKLSLLLDASGELSVRETR